MTQIKALLFDFDGLLVETEWSDYKAWAELYEEHGHDLTLEEWSVVVGTINPFDPMAKLRDLTELDLEEDELRARRLARKLELLEAEQLRPGVQACLEQSRELGLTTAIVTSSARSWIEENLERIACPHEFDVIVSADGNRAVAKPNPALYSNALECLGVGAAEAIAFEDSPNGIKAAKAAGLFCVAVPNRVTASLDLSQADIQLSSLEETSLQDLIALAEGVPPAS